MKIRIVGSGLMGTSLGLALRSAGHELEMVDQNSVHEKLAKDLVGSQPIVTPDLVVVATPVEMTLAVLLEQYKDNPDSRFIDISGLKSNLLLEVGRIPGLNARFLGTHPMAGREFVGPESARADLFEGRAWIITPSPQTDEISSKVLVRALLSSTHRFTMSRLPSSRICHRCFPRYSELN